MDYYRYLEFDEKYGIIPVQNGKNLTLNMPVTSQVSGAKGVKADCITDGADLNSSDFFQKSSNSPVGAPPVRCRHAEECQDLRNKSFYKISQWI